jgi:ABC-2 type transport system permease protein
MMIISTITVFVIVLGLVGLAVGLGAVYPRFEAENLAAVATGFGGLIFMIFSAIYVAVIITLEAWPVYAIFVAQVRNTPLSNWKIILIVLCFLGVIAANLVAVFLPMRAGLQHLRAREGN